ncbi:13675_t:CDS:1, partial [Racocetra fulgida]
HKTNKNNFESQEHAKKQASIRASFSAVDIKNETIEDLIESFAIANIPLEKVDRLIPFFRKHLKY